MMKETQGWEVGEEEFLNLKVLKLGGFKIPDWEVAESSFPRLDRLVLKDMRYLDELPSSFEDVLTLKVIQIQGCRASLGASARSILSAQLDIGNEELKILISDELEDYRPWRENSRPLMWDYPNSWEIYSAIYTEKISQKQKTFNESEDDEMGLGILDDKKDLGLYKKDATERCVAAVGVGGLERRHVASTRRTNNLLFRHNFQARQVIMSWHYKEDLKRNG